MDLFAFVGVTQPKTWAKLESMHGSPELARTKFTQRLVNELDSRGTISVLRKGVTDLGVTIRLAFFAPAHDLTPELKGAVRREPGHGNPAGGAFGIQPG